MLAVTAPAVRLAGLEKAVHLVGAACNPAFTIAAAVFAAEVFAMSGGGAARYGARLFLLPAAVCGAMLESLSCSSGVSINLAPCLTQRLRATASVLQPSISHTLLLPPPCLVHNPLD